MTISIPRFVSVSSLLIVSAACGPARQGTSPSGAPSATEAAYVYRATIGDRHLVMRLECRGTCTGYDFSTDSEARGSQLVRETAPSTFEEVLGHRAEAAVTGRFVMDGPVGRSPWSGHWSAANGAPTKVTLVRVPADGHAVSVPRVLIEGSRSDADCKVTVHGFEVLGLRDTALEGRINHAFAPETLAGDHLLADGIADDPAARAAYDDSTHGARILCRDFSGRGGLFFNADVSPALLDDRLLSVRSEYGFDGGGAHPSDGVTAMTVDLNDGHALDARDLLIDPAHEPVWSAWLTPTAAFAEMTGGNGDVTFQIGTHPAGPQFAWSAEAWTDFYLTTRGIALVPGVPEAARALRHEVQEVTFAKALKSLRTDGPASYLYRAIRPE